MSRHGRRVELAGVRVTIGSPAACEAADFVVCGAVSHFPDDVHGACDGCGRPIVHRPYVPVRPPKICLRCAFVFATPRES